VTEKTPNKTPAPTAVTAQSFERSLDEMEAVVEELESGEVPLERALELFEKGMQLSQTCRKQLEEAETRVEMLIRKGSSVTVEPFPTPSGASSPRQG
jgi:exodeoxyribonuclease VII small subunit